MSCNIWWTFSSPGGPGTPGGTGATGFQGPSGRPGATGFQGPPGQAGATGSVGGRGFPGDRGKKLRYITKHLYTISLHYRLYVTLSTSGSWQRCVFSREGRISCHEVFFIIWKSIMIRNTYRVEQSQMYSLLPSYCPKIYAYICTYNIMIYVYIKCI